mgnify:CR=1 FL=1
MAGKQNKGNSAAKKMQKNTEIKKVVTWLRANELSLNVAKTHAMVFSNRSIVTNHAFAIQINDATIEIVHKTKFLGVMVDNKLSFGEHINYIHGKLSKGLGIIKKARWCGGGGNCVVIKHNSTYKTVYAHMSKFASGIRSGVRVKQGQTIGYVGSTGKSTGPHLHYEVIINGKKVNSQKLKLPSGKILKNEERKLFETKKIKLDVLKSEKIVGLN